mgnify:CR=1 FL=1
MSIKNGAFVMPGDKLGIIEQYLLGKGTYEDNGEIKSSVLGNVQIDSKMKDGIGAGYTREDHQDLANQLF